MNAEECDWSAAVVGMTTKSEASPTEGALLSGRHCEAGFFSRWTYAWAIPLFRIARQRLLTLVDVAVTPVWLQSAEQGARLWKFWQRKQAEGRPWRWILTHFQLKCWSFSILYSLISEGVSWCSPVVVRQLLKVLQRRDLGQQVNLSYLYGLSGLFLIIMTIRSLFENYSTILVTTMGCQIRAGLMTTLYEKSQRFSQASRQKYEGGTALNVVAVDPGRVANLMQSVNVFWIIPFRLLIASILCIYYLKYAALPGLLVVFLVIPVLLAMVNRTKRYRAVLAKLSDARMEATQESLYGIKVLKYLAWESVAARKIQNLRDEELKYLRKMNILYGISLALTFWTPIFAATVSIAVSVLITGEIQAEAIFAAIMSFQALIAPLRALPSLVSTIVSARTSLNRISDFLLAPEVGDTAFIQRDCSEGLVVEFKDATLVWEAPPPDIKNSLKGNKKSTKKTKRRKTLELPSDLTRHSDLGTFSLSGITLSIPKGALVAVIGPIGAGKTSLLEALLGDLKLEQGRLAIAPGTIGYCEQHAFIRNGTVKENILFGRPFHGHLYRQVVEECGLTKDLELLPYGDETLIGDRGATLSGGQKQRIGLARVFYAQPDLILLDDPFSAVDASVGRLIFESIKDGSLISKTRIIATHNRNILDKVDFIIILDKGRLVAAGTFKELLSTTDPRLAAIRQMLLIGHAINDEKEEDEEQSEECDSEEESHESSSNSDSDSEVELKVNGECRGKNQSPGKIIDRLRRPARVEEKISKRASPQSIQAYIDGCGGRPAVLLVLTIVAITELVRVSKDFFMKNQVGSMSVAAPLFMGVYSGLGLLQGVLCGAANYIAVLCCTRGSRYIHEICIGKVLGARIAVFDTTPIGRILSRFGRDLEVIDNNFPDKLTFLVTSLSIILAALLVIVWTSPVVSLTFVLPVIGAYYIQRKFGLVWRQLQQLNGQALGPVVAHYAETLNGLSTIRVMGTPTAFTKQCQTLIDEYSGSFWWMAGVRRWLGLRSELIANTYVFFLMCLCIHLNFPYQVVGLILTYMVNAADSIDWSMKTLAEVESCFVSVERLYKYSMDLPGEVPGQQPNNRGEANPVTTPPPLIQNNWPRQGKVVFENVTVQYRPDLPPALKDVSFTLEPGEKIAVVGRTGAGKSSIITCLFRFVELTFGRIMIDEIDICTVPFSILRGSLAMVPQDPILFRGSVRSNLDPEGQMNDETIWAALDATFLRDLVAGSPAKLEIDVSNFSIGQQQLVCLARAMLRNSRLVIMDEATSSIDSETESLIQSSLRTAFRNSTVITVAHRLETIMAYDRVVVMGGGQVLEVGTPNCLAATKGSIFAEMMAASGIVINPSLAT